jgi:hypothetical protein
MFENTSAAVDQLIEHMQEAVEEGTLREWFTDLSSSERQAMSQLWDLCRTFQDMTNDVWEQADKEEWLDI